MLNVSDKTVIPLGELDTLMSIEFFKFNVQNIEMRYAVTHAGGVGDHDFGGDWSWVCGKSRWWAVVSEIR